ncbi:hypothetical protein ABOB75_25165, partial [Escherichia coli]
DDREPARIQHKHPYQTVRALFSRQPSVRIVAEPVLRPVAVAQAGDNNFTDSFLILYQKYVAR